MSLQGALGNFNFADPGTPEPNDPPPGAILAGEDAWDAQEKSWARREEAQANSQARAVAKGQDTDHAKDKLHEGAEKDYNLSKLLSELKMVYCESRLDETLPPSRCKNAS